VLKHIVRRKPWPLANASIAQCRLHLGENTFGREWPPYSGDFNQPHAMLVAGGYLHLVGLYEDCDRHLGERGRKPLKILEVHGRYYSFDANGNAAEAFQREVRQSMDLLPGLGTDNGGTVVDIGPEVRRERFMREHRWELTKHDLDRIAADIWKKPMVAEKVKDVKAVAGRGKLKRAPKGP
jgi:hypothetical protein